MLEKSPFKFLDSYTSEDKNIFFGREHEIEELYQKIFNAKHLILHGSSGTGKTSLVQCGLAGKFAETDWMPIIVRRGADLNTSIKNTLSQFAITPFKKAKTLGDYVRSVYLDFFKPIYLIFDQFEELFIFGTDEEIKLFISELKECLSSDISCRFIFVIRGEYLENITGFEDHIPDFFENRMRIERMTRTNATRVITETCKAFNISISENFAPLLIERLSTNKSTIELTYLQVYLDKLYKKAKENNNQPITFDEALLQKSGMIEDVLSEFLDEQVVNTKDPETAMMILKSFVSDEGTKKPCTAAEVKDFVHSLGKELTEEKINALLKLFVDLRILKDKDDTDRFELRHDALAKKIFEQISSGEKELIEVRQFFTNRYQDYQRRGVLMNEQDINYLIPYLSKLFLDEDQKEFINRCQKTIRRSRNRRRNIALIIGSAILITLAGFTLVALNERNAAIIQSKIAEQKTIEALQQKELSEKAKEMALQASKESMDAKSFAELQSKIAEEQKKIAEQQSLEAKKQSALANDEKLKALQQEQIAKQKSAEALKQKLLADSSSTEANRLRLISVAQNILLKASTIKSDPTLASLLVCNAYNLIKENNGNLLDPKLYDALDDTYQQLDPKNIKTISSLGATIKCAAMKPDSAIEMFCNDGNVYTIAANGNNQGKTLLANAATGLLDFATFNANGKYLVISYTDFSVKLFDVANPTAPVFEAKENKGLIRAVAFNNNNSVFATAGRDSLVVVWENKKSIAKINLPSRVRSLQFNSDNKLIYAGCEDGNIYEVNVSNNNFTTLFTIPGARVQVLQLVNNFLVAGSSNGDLSFYDISKGKLKNEFNLGNSIEFININLTLDMILVGCNNQVIFYAYLLNDFSLIPINKSNVLKPAPKNSFLMNNGDLIFICDDNSLTKRNINRDKLFNNSIKSLTRELTIDEWNEYIGSDVPYKKLISP